MNAWTSIYYVSLIFSVNVCWRDSNEVSEMPGCGAEEMGLWLAQMLRLWYWDLLGDQRTPVGTSRQSHIFSYVPLYINNSSRIVKNMFYFRVKGTQAEAASAVSMVWNATHFATTATRWRQKRTQAKIIKALGVHLYFNFNQFNLGLHENC